MTGLFTAMENVFFSQPAIGWEERCARIAAAGFTGVYAVPYPLRDDDFPRLRELAVVPAAHGLRVSAIYANLDLAQPADSPAGRRLRRLFEESTGAPRIELSVKCSDAAHLPPDLESAVCAALEPLLAIADRRGFSVALYPHSFYPLDRLAQVRRVLARLGHPRLGFVFPLSHLFALNPPAEVLAQLAGCAADITNLNVCGCRRAGPAPAKCAHLPLDEGEMPYAAIQAVLQAARFTGEIILQGHGWPGDIDDFLRRSLQTLRHRPSG